MKIRYDILNKLRNYQKLVKFNDYNYQKIIQSGGLAKKHSDYDVGFYDVLMSVIKINDQYACRVYFGTIDDGDFGSWNYFDSEEKALKLLNKIVNKFKDISRLPSFEELNFQFRELGVYFYFE